MDSHTNPFGHSPSAVLFRNRDDFQLMTIRKRDLTVLHEAIKNCRKCSLHETRKNAVPGEGPSDAQIMLVGEAPGAQEDKSGRPFVGKSGALLFDLLNKIGLKREEVFITSILKSRPPGNRTPNKDEVDACLPYLEMQIEIINPEIIVLLGSVAISSLIGPWKLAQAHGRIFEADGRKYFMTYHPAAALRFPKVKARLIDDLDLLRKEASSGD